MSKVTRQRAPVSLRALRLRVNRALDKEGKGKRLVMNPPNSAACAELGTFMLITERHGHDGVERPIVRAHIDVEQFARDLGVLRVWERVLQ